MAHELLLNMYQELSSLRREIDLASCSQRITGMMISIENDKQRAIEAETERALLSRRLAAVPETMQHVQACAEQLITEYRQVEGDLQELVDARAGHTTTFTRVAQAEHETETACQEIAYIQETLCKLQVEDEAQASRCLQITAAPLLPEHDADRPIRASDVEYTEDSNEVNSNRRRDFLAGLFVPNTIPETDLQPIILPDHISLTEFLSSAPKSMTSLQNYRILTENRTIWVPEIEEHGYFLVPQFKCHTNPFDITKHYWGVSDIFSEFPSRPDGSSIPFPCFYKKGSRYYYAGEYRVFRMDNLGQKEWSTLSGDNIQAITAATIKDRQNVRVSDSLDIQQLYDTGALKVAVLGLQCVNYNPTLGRVLLEQAAKCREEAVTGGWRLEDTLDRGSDQPSPYI